MISPPAVEALAQLFAIAFVGRVILSLLPPGLPGRHGFRELPATWAASHLLGGTALAFQARLADLAGLEVSRLALVAPWLLAAFARWITLPAAMVPRHEPLAEPPGAMARILWAASAVIVLAAAGVLHLGVAADGLALLACCSFALAGSRRSPTRRAIVVLALAVVLAAAIVKSEARTIPLALGAGSGACFASVWMRRGDRRAALLAVIAFASCGLLGPRAALFGLAGLFAMWVHTPEASKRWVLARSLAAFVIGSAAGWDEAAGVITPMTSAVLVVVSLAIWRRKLLVDAQRPAEPAARSSRVTIDPTRAERDAVRDTVILCLFPLAARGELSSLVGLAPALLPLAPLVLLELGLVLGPAERPPGAAVAEPGDAR
ncbi:MAG: hypothetical protein ACKVXR_02000 [Planctomycetota bacterium]